MKRVWKLSTTPKRLVLILIAAVVLGSLISLGVLAASTGVSSTRQLVTEMLDTGSRFILSIAPVSIVDGPSAEEYAVYDSVFNTLAESSTSSELDESPLSIMIETNLPSEHRWRIADPAQLAHCFEHFDVDDETAADMLQKGSDPFIIRRGLGLPVEYELISARQVEPAEELPRLLGPSAERYFTLSRVGFDSRQSQAIVYVEDHCSLCGFGGSFWALSKQDGHWQVMDRCITWES